MIKIFTISSWDDSMSCDFAVDMDVVPPFFVGEPEGLITYLTTITKAILGAGMRDDLNLYGMSMVAEESGFDLFTRGQHGITLIGAEYENVFTNTYFDTDLTELPKAPEPQYN